MTTIIEIHWCDFHPDIYHLLIANPMSISLVSHLSTRTPQVIQHLAQITPVELRGEW